MKAAKLFCFFTGFLAVLLSGCFNPIAVTPPGAAENPLAQSFTVDILIGADTQPRSVAGPDAARIKLDYRNMLQLIVMDDDGAIVDLKEARRKNDTDEVAMITIDSIPYDKTYHFLLLMGHWERDYAQEAGGNYEYTQSLPTLLAAGLKTQKITGDGKVTITMRPIVVDTKFTAPNQATEPVVKDGKPEAAPLLPLDWNITWTIKRGLSGDGLADLVKAQKIADKSAGDALRIKGEVQTILREGDTDGTWSEAVLKKNVITQVITDYTSGFKKIGTKGSANFKMEYVPFNLSGNTGTNPWTEFDKESAFDLSTGGPVWIIRNGVNDLAQDENTNFNLFYNPKEANSKSANGNGAVRFEVAAKTPDGTPSGSTLALKDGIFAGPASSTTPEIGFTTDGYEGKAEVYYAVVPAKDKAPEISAYMPVDTVETGKHKKKITVPEANGDYDVYVMLYKDGAVSDPLVINTKEGETGVDWKWGDEPYFSLYVKSDGKDSNSGDKAHPLATVQKALEKMASAYAADASWPEKGTESESPGAIVILDTVKVTQEIDINNDARKYPPIVLRDDPKTPGGKLQATTAIGINNEKGLLRLAKGAKVTLSGGLILAGTGKDSKDGIRGVSITDKSTFTMTGGVISGNSTQYTGSGVSIEDGTFTMSGGKIFGNSIYSSPSTGGGIYMKNGTFTMSGGVISGNSAERGGGVSLYSSTFTMSGGEISGNSTPTTGGGVYLEYGTFTMNGGVISGNSTKYGGGVALYYIISTFIMNGGEISGNSADDGGGVHLGIKGTFTMSGGEISGNSADNEGGGIYLNDGTFTMTGGEIFGNSAKATGGGICLDRSVNFAKTGGTIYSYNSAAPKDPHNNKVVDTSGAILNNKGHAVYIKDTSYRKETTVGPDAKLYNNFPKVGNISGWD